MFTEIGNILLNACLGTFGNLLKVQVSFSVPHLTLETLRDLLDRCDQPRRPPLRADRARRIPAARSQVTGYLVIVLSVASLDRLMRRIEEWEVAEAGERPGCITDAARRGDAALVRRADDHGVFITDTELVVRSWNHWLERFTGLPSANVVGRPLLQLFPDLASAVSRRTIAPRSAAK